LPGNSFAVALTPSALPVGVTGAKLIKGQSVILIFDSKGAIKSAYTNPAMGAPISAVYSQDGGINVLAQGVGAQSLSIFRLNTR